MRPYRQQSSPPDISLITEQAIAERRHSRTHKRLCNGCYKWVDEILYVTIDRKPLCLQCSIEKGVYVPPTELM